MDRPLIYPGAVAQDTDFLSLSKNAMISDGYIAKSILGGNTLIDGLSVGPTTPTTMSVTVGPGSISVYTTVDGTPYGTLPADTGELRKTGINTAPVSLPLTAPTTAGQSIVYLVQCSYSEIDTTNVTLSYYNSVNPSQPLLGPAGGGTQQATMRREIVQIQVKAGTPGASPSAPVADIGWYRLAYVTVAYGATSISQANITYYLDARMSLNLPTTGANTAYAITATGITLNPSDPTQLYQAMSALASGAAKLGYVPVKTGGGHASSRTTNVYLDYNDSTSLPTMQADGVGFSGDLATAAWTTANYQAKGSYQPALGFTPVQQGTGDVIVLQYDPNSKLLNTKINGTYMNELVTDVWVSSRYQPLLGFNPVQRGPVFGGDPDYSIQLGYSGGYISYKVNNDSNATGVLASKAYADSNFLNYNNGGTLAGNLVAPGLFANSGLFSKVNSRGVALGYYDRAVTASESSLTFPGQNTVSKMSNGWIIQTFGFTISAGATIYGFSYPNAFPNACNGIIVQVGASYSGVGVTVGASPTVNGQGVQDNRSCSITCSYDDGAKTYACIGMAWGT